MSTLREFATFPLLEPVDRARLASFVVRCNLARDSSRLDETPLLEWLERMCGRRVTDRLWRPLLDSKFDGRYDDLPATYLWARTRRMSATRDSGGREVMGWLEGGYQTLVDALVARIESLGGRVHASTAVDRIVRGGVVVGGSLRPASLVLCTLAPPQARMVLDPSLRDECPPDHCRYLGVVCLVVRATRSVSPYYTLNITDRRIPLTTVVETTHVVDPDAAGGHLVYVTKYVDPSHDDLGAPVEDVRARYLEQMRRIPDMFAVPGLVLASTAHVYPEIVNGQAVIGVADRAVAGILERIEAPLEAAA
jgi:protoporphyrinogen oxidase